MTREPWIEVRLTRSELITLLQQVDHESELGEKLDQARRDLKAMLFWWLYGGWRD